jgi:ABC-type phosphate transport system permease subunit
MLLIFLAAGGIFWLFLCFAKFMSKTWKELKRIFEKEEGLPLIRTFPYRITRFFKEVWNSTWTQDFIGSLAMMFLALMLPGVTGMSIGLIASVMWSVYARVKKTNKSINHAIA